MDRRGGKQGRCREWVMWRLGAPTEYLPRRRHLPRRVQLLSLEAEHVVFAQELADARGCGVGQRLRQVYVAHGEAQNLMQPPVG